MSALLLLFLGPDHSLRADITGTVTIQGPPNSQDESFFARSNGCGESPIRHTENWKIGPKGELADVVVWIAEPKFTSAPAGAGPEIEIKQLGCRYVPHVIAVEADRPFKIINGDATLHNVRAKVYDPATHAPGADVFNFGQSHQGQADEQKFDAPGLYTLQCDVHAWMQAWVRVIAHRCFDVTGPEGAFRLQDGALLADGDYKIEAWHPKFAQPLEQTLHVKGGIGTVRFQFEGAKSF